MGFSKITFSINDSSWPRRRISQAVRGTASGTLGPQSQAASHQSRSLPKRSIMSIARAGEHLLSGYKVMPPQCPVQHHADGVLLNVINHHALRINPTVVLEHIQY